jgi:hypothetical protein
MSDKKNDDGNIDGRQPQSVPPSPDLARRSAVFQLLTAGTGLATVALLAPCRAHAAFGRCTVNGCYCCTYRGNSDNCSNCGHLYSDHGGGTCS